MIKEILQALKIIRSRRKPKGQTYEYLEGYRDGYTEGWNKSKEINL